MEYFRRLEVLQEQSSKLASRIASSQRSQRTAALGLKYITESAYEHDLYYTQLGRSFLLSSREEVVSDLQSQISTSAADLPRLQATMEQFDKLRKEQIEQITELKQQ